MKKPTILVAEGDAVQLDLSVDSLKSMGYKVLAAERAPQALTLIEHEEVDLVLLDLTLREGGGLELLRWLRTNRPDSKVVVVMSGDSASASLRELLDRRGVVSYLRRPYGEMELKRVLDSVLSPGGGFIGRVKRINLLDFIQLLVITGRSAMLVVINQRKSDDGVILFREGEIVDSWTRGLEGEPAFMEITSWEEGTFEELPFPQDGQFRRTINASVEELLLNAFKDQSHSPRSGILALEPPLFSAASVERLEEVLSNLSGRVPAFLGTCVFETAGGVPLAYVSRLEASKNFETTSALYSEVLKVMGDALEIVTGGEEKREELRRALITDKYDHVIIRPLLGGRFGLFVLMGVVGNVGVALTETETAAKALSRILSEGTT